MGDCWCGVTNTKLYYPFAHFSTTSYVGLWRTKKEKKNSCWLCQHWKESLSLINVLSATSLKTPLWLQTSSSSSFFYFALSLQLSLCVKPKEIFFLHSLKRKGIILEGCSWTFVKEVRPTQRHLLYSNRRSCSAEKPFAPSIAPGGANQPLRTTLLRDSIAWWVCS